MFKIIKIIISSVLSIFKNVVATILIILVISYICRGLGYKVKVWRSFKENIIDKLIVFDMPPKASLFTQFPYEYKYERNLPYKIIKENETLYIDKLIKPLWVGIFNSEDKSLTNSSLIIHYFSNNIKEANKHNWGYAWLTSNNPREYQYIYWRSITPKSGLPVHPPIEFEFIKPNERYKFEYIFLCDNYEPLVGHFFVEYKDSETK